MQNSPWNTMPLGECLTFITRGVAPSYVPSSPLAALNQKAIRWGFIQKEYLKYHDSNKSVREDIFIRKGDIVVNSTGDITIGRAYYFKKEWHNLFADSHVTILRLNRGVLLPEFLIYLFPLPEYQTKIYGLVTGATGQLELSKTNLQKLEVEVPPLPTQQKIAAILSAYDDLIENNTRRIKILEEMAQAIYREWFVQFRFPGHEGVRMVETEVGLVPEGWYVKQLREVAHEVRRSVQPDQIDSETPYFGLEHLPRKSISLTEWGKASEIHSTKLVFNKNEILFGKIRPYFHKVGIAPVDGVCSSDIIVIVPESLKYNALVLSCVSSEAFVAQATLTSQGTKMPRANWDILNKYPVVIPQEQLISHFNEIMRGIIDLVLNLIYRNRNLRQTRDLLLPRLVSGEIDVSEISDA